MMFLFPKKATRDISVLVIGTRIVRHHDQLFSAANVGESINPRPGTVADSHDDLHRREAYVATLLP